MIEFGQLINYSVLKILLNAFSIWIDFLYNLDILIDLYIFCMNLEGLYVFLIQCTLVTIFCLILDLLELLSVFA